MSVGRCITILALSVLVGCNVREPPSPPAPRTQVAVAGGVGNQGVEAGRPVAFPEGGLVMVVNPVVDPAGTGAVAVPHLDRAEIGIKIGARGTRTDATGLAVLDDLPVGTAVVEFPILEFPPIGSPAGTINVSIDQVGLVDTVVLYDPAFGPALFADLHYPRSGPDVLQLPQGVHEGPLEVSGYGTVVYGEVANGGKLATILDGDLIISGNGVRVRNLIVNGRVTILGGGVSVAFSEMDEVVIRGPDALLLRTVLHDRPVVTAPNALLLDNSVE